MCAEAVTSKDQRDPIPRPNRNGGWKFRISAVRPRDLLRPGVLEPPTEIVSIFGSRVAAAEPITRSVSQARRRGCGMSVLRERKPTRTNQGLHQIWNRLNAAGPCLLESKAWNAALD